MTDYNEWKCKCGSYNETPQPERCGACDRLRPAPPTPKGGAGVQVDVKKLRAYAGRILDSDPRLAVRAAADEIERLRRELIASRRDRERLDWLETHYGIDIAGWIWESLDSDNHTSMRDAVDAAIATLDAIRTEREEAPND